MEADDYANIVPETAQISALLQMEEGQSADGLISDIADRLIVLDLEWNSPYGQSNYPICNGVTLKNEIIEIGAVRYTQVEETFSSRIRPRFFREMNPYTSEITGLRDEDLQRGTPFLESWKAFLEWAGPEAVLATWSESDSAALNAQLQFFGAEEQVPHQFLDIQALFSCFILRKRKQMALSAALEYFGIQADEQLHRALTDAEYTCRILGEILPVIRLQTPDVGAVLEAFFFDPRAPYRQTFRIPLDRNQKPFERLRAVQFYCPICKTDLLESPHTSHHSELLTSEGEVSLSAREKHRGGQFVLRQFGRMVATRYCPKHGPIQIQAWQGRSAQGKPQPWLQCQIKGRAPGEEWWERMSRLEPQERQQPPKPQGIRTDSQ